MRVLFLTGTDNGNSGWWFSECIKLLGKESIVKNKRKSGRRRKVVMKQIPKKKTIKPSVICSGKTTFGKEILIEDYCVLRPNVTIGNNSEIRQYCFLAGDITIGKNVKIFQYSNIGKGSVIEDGVYIGPRVSLLNTRKISHGRKYSPEINAPTIKRGARIGSGSIILPGVIIGEECMIAAGSVVTKDTEPYWYYMGNPARKWKPVPEDERL